MQYHVESRTRLLDIRSLTCCLPGFEGPSYHAHAPMGSGEKRRIPPATVVRGRAVGSRSCARNGMCRLRIVLQRAALVALRQPPPSVRVGGRILPCPPPFMCWCITLLLPPRYSQQIPASKEHGA